MKKGNKLLGLVFLIGLSHAVFAQKAMYSLDFNPKIYTVQKLSVEGKEFTVRAFEKIVYVSNPVDTGYEVMNVFIPEEYFTGKSNNGYTAATAPIFFPNQVGGYMPAKPASTQNNPFGSMPPMGDRRPGGAPGGMPSMGDMPQGGMPPMGGVPPGGGAPGGMQPMTRQSAVLVALSKGYVVASAGARGRTTQDKNGVYTGKAPAALVDLKAALRYLKYNDKNMPGDAGKIISNGTSAGGAMSTLLGATGNNPDYDPYLKELGAAKGTDDIFAVSAYCPITNLDHADAAYEWQFNGVNAYAKMNFGRQESGTEKKDNTQILSGQQIAVSGKLKQVFPPYLNSLKLKNKRGELLTLDDSGNGNFKELVKSYVMVSAQRALASGTDLSTRTWLTVTNGKVTGIDWDAYVRYMERMKTPPAFDALDLSTPETQLFGTSTIDKQHFTAFSAENATGDAKKADERVIKMMNPMYYIGKPNTKTAKNWRIRHGTKDKDTGLAISVILGTTLENGGYNVNLELPWDIPHSGDYDLDELFSWIKDVCK